MRIAVAVLSVLLVAGCSANPGGHGGGKVAGASSGAVSAQPSPERLSKGEAGQRYLDIGRAANEATAAYNKEWVKPQKDFLALKAAADRAATANYQFAVDLEGTAWPAEAQAAIDDLLESVLYDQKYYVAVRDMTSLNQLPRIEQTFPPSTKKLDTARKVRVVLGLPDMKN